MIRKQRKAANPHRWECKCLWQMTWTIIPTIRIVAKLFGFNWLGDLILSALISSFTKHNGLCSAAVAACIWQLIVCFNSFQSTAYSSELFWAFLLHLSSHLCKLFPKITRLSLRLVGSKKHPAASLLGLLTTDLSSYLHTSSHHWQQTSEAGWCRSPGFTHPAKLLTWHSAGVFFNLSWKMQ